MADEAKKHVITQEDIDAGTYGEDVKVGDEVDELEPEEATETE